MLLFCLSLRMNLGWMPSMNMMSFLLMALMCGIVIKRYCARAGMFVSVLYVGVGSRSWSEMRECIIM